MKVYHPEIETVRKQLEAKCNPLAYGLGQHLWAMARTKELGSSQFKTLALYCDGFERLRAAGS